MRRLHLLALLVLILQPATLSAQLEESVSVPSTQQLHGLITDEAGALIAKLMNAQDKLRAGEFQSFRLLSGSVATYEMTKVSPRDAFLSLPFDQVWMIERIPTDNQPSRSFKLAYAPDGLGKLYWEIRVTVGIGGQLEQVTMFYMTPAPF